MIGTIRLPLVAAALSSLAIASLAVSAEAAPGESSARVSIAYQATELTTAAGRKQVRQRIDAAIADMCGPPIFFTRDESEALALCRDEALAAAMPQYSAALLRARTSASR